MSNTSSRRSKLFAVGAFALAASLCGVGGCGGSAGPDPTVDTGSEFIALGPAFEDYCNWEQFAIPDEPAIGGVHLAGPKTDFLNQRPPHGSTSFPMGTIIVKVVDVGDVAARQVFAMVKRGGTFDQSLGAPGWEFFELYQDATGCFSKINWRGYGPPNGSESYGGDPMVCIGCHSTAKNNDYVQSPPLQLSNF
ncbi:MAG TPA: hypothetical protein VGL13_06540 [Polyangiaceae bacterium]|jgi:hypothetical protein